GILETVKSYYNKTETVTRNLLWDANTGNVLVSSTTNGFDQTDYSANYPAYWAYPDLGSESARISATATLSSSTWTASSGRIDRAALISAGVPLYPGDEVILYNPSGV